MEKEGDFLFLCNNIQCSQHYENMPIQIYWNFYRQKNESFQIKNSDIFHISAQNIDCGFLLEPPRRGGSNKYPQSMFLSRNKKNDIYPCKPQFYYIKVGFKGVKIIQACLMLSNVKSEWSITSPSAWYMAQNFHLKSLHLLMKKILISQYIQEWRSQELLSSKAMPYYSFKH